MINLTSIRMLILSVLLTAAVNVSAESAPEYYEAAVIRFENKEYRTASILLKNALRLDPQHLPSRILLGKSLIHAGDVAGAEKDLKIAREYGADESLVVTLLGSAYLIQGKYETLLDEIRSGGRSTEIETQILVLRAYAQIHLGDLEKAEAELNRAHRLMPDNPGPLLGLAMVAIRQGDLEGAERFVALARERQPQESEIQFAQGEIKRLRGENDSAIQHFNRSIELDPQKMDARLSRAALLITSDQEEAAQEDIDYILTYSPNNLQAIYLKAMILARAGKYAQASAELQVVSQTLSNLKPGFINSHGPTMLLMGTLDYLQNDLEKAKSRLKRYVKLNPQHLQPHLLLAKTLIKLGDNVGAVLTLKPLLQQHGENPDLLFLIGTAYLNDGLYTEASEYLDKAASRQPDLPKVRTNQALSMLGTGNTEGAMQALEAVLSLEGDHAKAGLLLANIQLRKGQFSNALKTLELLIGESPDNPLLHNLMGMAYLNQGEREAAHAAFSRALQLAPDFHPARLNLAAVEAADRHYPVAREQFDQILRQTPDDVRAMEGMAKLAELQNRKDEAISWMEKIRNTDSMTPSPAVLSRLAELYLENGRPELALEVANELGYLQPGELTALDLKGRAYLALGNRESAADQFRIMHQSRPNSAETLQRIAALLMQAGDLNNAEKAVNDALQKAPGLIAARGTRILLEQQLGRSEQALTHARQLRDDHPDRSLGYRLLGDLLMSRGEFRAAADAYAGGLSVEPESMLLMLQFRAEYAANNTVPWSLLTRWIENHPEDTRIHDLLGALYNRAGDYERARIHYEKVLELQPDQAAAYNNLASVYARLGLPKSIDLARRAYELDPNDAAVNDTLGWLLVQSGEFQSGLEYLRQAQVRASARAEVRYHLGVALYGLSRYDEAERELKLAIAQSETFAGAADAHDLLEKIARDKQASGN